MLVLGTKHLAFGVRFEDVRGEGCRSYRVAIECGEALAAIHRKHAMRGIPTDASLVRLSDGTCEGCGDQGIYSIAAFG